ncbi:MAG: protoheme IX farnesyltransferase [Desulfuromonas sp.]|nr:MAG: protoheme IX farnesyltransferase [Desulfuromonas sp.]
MKRGSLLEISRSDQLQLMRPRLSLMVGLAALSGYLAAPTPHSPYAALQLTGGAFLLTAAASVFNQVQERSRDRWLPRTCDRPLPSGRCQPRPALQLATLLALLGVLLLAPLSAAAAGVGLFALAWYNLLYTPLKPRTSYVLLLGALGGALPPLLGWLVSDASPLAPKAVHLYLLLILWQIPHFLCLSLRDDLRGQQLGLKTVPPSWSQPQVMRMVRLWAIGLGALLLTALPLPLLDSFSGSLGMGLLGICCIGSALRRGSGQTPRHWASTTGKILHAVLAAALLTISIDPLIIF